MKIHDFQKYKENHKKIVMVTCYDYTFARLLSTTSVDCFIVGDSLAMTLHGFKDTLCADIEMMRLHTAAVSRGAGQKFIISDLPFLTYKKSRSEAVSAVQTLMQAGAHAVKLEGAAGNLDLVQHLSESGIPVMGHLGLTPQFIHGLGGYKVQGTTEDSATRLKQDALLLQQAGCFSLVLECVPNAVAKDITATLTIPTIGIGAGPDTDGQVLVLHDLLGLNKDFKPKFVKNFVDGAAVVNAAIEDYSTDTKNGAFPSHEYCY